MTKENILTNLAVLRKLADREHELMNDRTNIFLIWQSILMAGFALGKDAPTIVTVLPPFGFLASILWMYVGMRNRSLARYYRKEVEELEKKVPEEDRIYTMARQQRNRRTRLLPRLSVTSIIAIGIPALWALIWIVMLVLWQK